MQGILPTSRIQSTASTKNRPAKMYMGVSKYSGTPKWMVYNGKPYYKMDDLGVPKFTETPT